MPEEEAPSGRGGIGYESGPGMLLFADDAGDAAEWSRTAASLGCRTIAVAPIEGGAERLARHVAADVVVLTGREGAHGDLEGLLDGIEAGVDAGRFTAIFDGPLALADRLAGVRLHPKVDHLLDVGAAERAEALAGSLERPVLRLHDVNKAQATVRLQQLSEEVGRIATLLSALSEHEGAAVAMAGLESNDGDPQKLEAGQIRAMIRVRRLRDHFFKRDIFADPAWDMLLDLMASRLEKKAVAVSSLCIASAVPPTTALRWIKSLCDQGLFVRIADPEDGRRVFIELSDSAAAAMESYLKAVQRITPFVL